jgi:hypothetical protein
MQILVPLPDASLSTPKLKLIHQDARWNTRIALTAMGTVNMIATAAKAKHGKFTIEFLIHRLAGINK